MKRIKIVESFSELVFLAVLVVAAFVFFVCGFALGIVFSSDSNRRWENVPSLNRSEEIDVLSLEGENAEGNWDSTSAEVEGGKIM